MSDGLRRAFGAVLGAAILCLIGLAPAHGQSTSGNQQLKAAKTHTTKVADKGTAKPAGAEKTLLAEDVFKDIRVLRRDAAR